MHDLSFNWIYKVPCILSVFANLFFLIWIVCVLVSKLNTNMSDYAALVKTAKAIGKFLFEIPLHTKKLTPYFIDFQKE